MNLKEALDKLFSLHQFGIKLGLENIQNLLGFIGNPEKELNAFHIAGSNGKGSTASFINSILIEAGYNVGLYTSPHFVKFNERIRVNSQMIPDEYVVEFMNSLNDYIEKHSPTFFELTTAMAFKYFKEMELDFVVIETGLGGRLDATNVLDPLASVITTISKEHTNILSDSISKIAYEKCEIIKKNRKAFAGFLIEDAMAVAKDKTENVNAAFYELANYTEKKSEYLKLNLDEFHYKIYNTPLSGEYQINNAALAVLTVNKTLNIKDAEVYDRGIKQVIVNSGIQGRFETYCESPKIIFDAAHNTEGIQVFTKEFQKISSNYEKRILIFGGMRDKELKEMLKGLDNYFDEIYAATIDYERAAKTDEIIEIGKKENIEIKNIDKPSDFVKKLKKTKNNDCLVILGSIYLLGKIKEDLLN